MAISYASISIFFCTLILCGTVYVMEKPAYKVHSCDRRNAVTQEEIAPLAEKKTDQPFIDPFLMLAVACKELRRVEQAAQQQELDEKQKKYMPVAEQG